MSTASIAASPGAQVRRDPADLHNHRIYEIFDGKSLATLEPNLRRLKGRERVKVVCMDLRPPFRSIVQRLFPNAKIIADRFHVIRQVMETFLEFSCAADPDIRRKRGVIRVLRTKGEIPGSAPKAARVKNSLRRILRLKEKVWQLLHEAPEIFKKPGRTIRQWFKPIIRMWRFSKSNGITEGFHRKMKLIQRMAYGYLNSKNYRLRVLIECGHIVV